MLFLQPNLELNPASFEILFGFVGPQSWRGHSIGRNPVKICPPDVHVQNAMGIRHGGDEEEEEEM